MTATMSNEAVHFGEVVEESLARAGGVELVRAAESDPDSRRRCSDLLGDLGLWDLDPHADVAQLEAAAAAVRAAGGTALPYPVAERLAAADLSDVDAIGFVSPERPRIGHGGLGMTWLAVGEDAHAPLRREGPLLATKLGPFAADVELGATELTNDPHHLTMLLTLQGWTLLGMLESAAADTYRYVQERHQFGRPVSDFQGLRFALTDVEVEIQGLREAARYTLWSVGTGRREGWTDALALRLMALDAARTVFRVCHQAHGAIGLCDESNLSWLSRHSQVLRRLPWGRTRTEVALLDSFVETPFSGPFSRPIAPS